MHLLSVNVGRPESIDVKGGKTGIFKRPMSGPVHVGTYGLAGDAICDTKHHGGRDQAVYLYGVTDYAWWSAELGTELEPGTFGENLTVTGLESADCLIGDRFHMGSGEDAVILEVTAPRIPCVTLATRMGDPNFVKRFRFAERPGLYCRVIRPGAVQAGDTVELVRYKGETISAREMFRLFYAPQPDEQTLRRHLAAPIAERGRTEKEEQLQVIIQNNQ
ncbi:MAG: MOSC domain-containing protein [Caldilineaceae bacterium]|nr:MOSC domain-containing protein [Caldilineaceae bacterium]